MLAWVNDEKTKRAYENSDDACLTLKKMLDSGEPPDNWAQLVGKAKATNAKIELNLRTRFKDSR